MDTKPLRSVEDALACRTFLHRLGASATLLCCLACLSAATTTGYDNAARSELPGTLLSHPIDNDSRNTGRTTTIQYVGGWIFVGAEVPGSNADQDKEFRVYNIEDPTNPIRMWPSDFGHAYDNDSWGRGNFGWNAHGSAMVGSFLHPYRGRGVDTWGGTFHNQGPRPALGGHRAGMAGPWDATLLWYGSEDRVFEIGRRFTDAEGNGNNRKILATIDHTSQYGGGDWHPMFFGDLLIYARSGSADTDGVVVYRLSYHDFDDPETASITPHLVGTLPGGFKGYWPNLCSDGSGLYVLGTHTRIFMIADLTDAAMPGGDDEISLVSTYSQYGARNATYPTYQDQYAFVDEFKIDITKMLAGDADPVVLELDEDGTDTDASQMSRPLGNLWLTGGYGGRGGMAVWVQQQEPDTRRPKVMYHIPQSGRTDYPRHAPLSFIIPETSRKGGPLVGEDFTVRKVLSDGSLGEVVQGLAIFDMSGIFTFTPYVGLNADATYQVDFVADPASGAGFQDAAGNYIEPYSFRFATGGGLDGDPPPSIDSFTADDERVEPGTSVTVAIAATTTGSAEYRFNFGDGYGSWSSSSSAGHAFTAEGRYRILGQVRDGSGFTDTATLVVAVVSPPVGPFPTQSGSMAIGDDDGRRLLWVVNPDADTVTVLDATSGGKLAEHPVGKDPRSIARDGDGRYWVTCHDDDRLDLLAWDDAADRVTTVRQIALDYGSAPFGVCAAPDGQTVYVSCFGSGELARFAIADPDNPTLIDSVPTPRAIAVSGDGATVYVTRFISPAYWGEVGRYTSTDSVFEQNRVLKVQASALDPSGDRNDGIPNYLSSICIARDGRHAMVTSGQANTGQGEFYGIDDLEHDSTIRSIVSVIDIEDDDRDDDPSRRRDVDNSADPSAVTFTPDGDYAFITLQGSNRLIAIDTQDLEARSNVTATVLIDRDTGLAPQGVLVDGVVNRIFVQNFMDRSVSVFDASGMLDGASLAIELLTTTDTVANELLSDTVLRGKQIFYNADDERMSSESYISCATCHIDGGHDGRVWDFTGRGEGLRRTTDLRGRAGVGGHGNVHWSANFDEIQDFEHDIRGPFAGQGFIEDDDFASNHPGSLSTKRGLSRDLDALAAYVSSLGRETVPRSPHRAADGSLTAEAVAGQAVFAALDCASCHSGEIFTDGRSGPVTGLELTDIGSVGPFSGGRLGGGTGSLTGIDIPTLWGLHHNSSYLHHGLVERLEDVFSFVAGVHYEAEDLTGIWTVADAIDLRHDEGTPWPARVRRNFFGGTIVEIKRDREDLDGDGVLDDGEDVNGNGILDEFETGIEATGVDGGAGGAGVVFLRYHATNRLDVTIRVNGTDHPLSLDRSPQVPNGWRASWEHIAVPVTLAAGTSNTVQVIRGDRDIAVDALWVANESHLTTADAHRRVLAASETDRANLLAYLRQIDGRDAAGALDSAGDRRLVFTQRVVHVSENGGSIDLTVRRTGSPDGAISIDYRTVELALPDGATAGSDFSSASGTLSWGDGDMSDRSITITILDDSVAELGGSERFGVVLENPTTGVVIGEPSLTQVLIIDNEVLTPIGQTLVATHSAVDQDLDGTGDVLVEPLVAGQETSQDHVALLVFQLADDPGATDLWGADLQLTLADDAFLSADLPAVDAHLLRVGSAATVSAADYEAAGVGLVGDDLFHNDDATGDRRQLSGSEQQAFLTLLRDQGAGAGDHVVIKLMVDGAIPTDGLRYLFADGSGSDPAPTLELIRQEERDPRLRRIEVRVEPGVGVEASIDEGASSPVPVTFENLLPDEPHRVRLHKPSTGDG